MRRDRIGPPCRGSGRRTSPSCPPVHPFCHPLRARGPGRRSARCYGVARQRDRSRQNSRGPRACFLSGISGSRVGAEESGAASKRKTRRLLTNRPCSSLVHEESDSKERLRVSMIVQRLYNYAVKKTVEL